MRYLARLKYNGSDFCGWQIQPNSSTVQEVIEEKLSMLLNEDVKVIGCGRTDTGVQTNARGGHHCSGNGAKTYSTADPPNLFTCESQGDGSGSEMMPHVASTGAALRKSETQKRKRMVS